MKTDPVLIIVGGVGTVVTALTNGLLAFTNLSSGQVSAVGGGITIVLLIILAFITRQNVFAPQSVENLLNAQHALSTGSSVSVTSGTITPSSVTASSSTDVSTASPAPSIPTGSE